MNITHAYFSRIMPVIKIGIELDIPMIDSLYKYEKSGTISFTVIENEHDGDGNITNSAPFMTGAFNYIAIKPRSDYITSTDTITSDLVDVMKSVQIFECYLINMDMVNNILKGISNIFKDTSKSAIFKSLFQLRGITKNIIATPPNNDNGKISYAVFPYGDLVGNITYLNAHFGLYKSTPIVYYDGSVLYCIDKTDPNIKLSSTSDYAEINIFLVNDSDPKRNIDGSCNDLSTKTHYINSRNIPTINEHNDRKCATEFATLIGIDNKGNIHRKTISEEYSKLKMVYVHNTLTMEQIYHDNILGDSLSIGVSNISLSIIKPYKIFRFMCDTQYSNLNLDEKLFNIAGADITITREGGAGDDANYLGTVTISLIQQIK